MGSTERLAIIELNQQLRAVRSTLDAQRTLNLIHSIALSVLFFGHILVDWFGI